MKVIILLLVVAISGCATSAKLNDISLGMSKQEVIHILGYPASTSAKQGVEYMKYKLYGAWDGDMRVGGGAELFFVRIINGVVESYGRIGDFDSTNMSEPKATNDLQ